MLRGVLLYAAGLLTYPVFLWICVGCLWVARALNSAGWSGHWFVYDRNMLTESERGYIEGEWALRSWGPFHRGSWERPAKSFSFGERAGFKSVWVGFGRRSTGERAWRSGRPGIQIIKVVRGDP